MWGIIPAAGVGSRIQPLGFSKELLPLPGGTNGQADRPRAVSEYLVQRMLIGGARKLCFVISPGKADIVGYYSCFDSAELCYVVQPSPAGLCDAVFRARSLITPHESILVGLPDTIWFPENGFRALPDTGLSFLLFPVAQPERFDAVLSNGSGRVQEIRVKQPNPESSWIWGAFKLSAGVFEELYQLWCERERSDEYLGTLVNAYLERGGEATAVRAGTDYIDVGTMEGYRNASRLLTQTAGAGPLQQACAEDCA